MLTHLTREQLHTIMHLSEQAQQAGDRLLNRAYKVDASADSEPPGQARPDEDQVWTSANDALRESGLTGPVQTLDMAIERLSPDARNELYAIALIGRGDYAARQWEEALTAAQAVSDASQPRMLADMDSLPACLSKGMYQLRMR